MTNWFKTITGGVAFYVLFGLLLMGGRLAPALLGYEGAYEEVMAISALPVFAALWMLCLPFFILVGVSIEMILELLGVLRDRIKLK